MSPRQHIYRISINVRKKGHKSNLEYVCTSSYNNATAYREKHPMKAYVLDTIRDISENRPPLLFTEMPDPLPSESEILVRVSACGICHTELDEIEGRTPPPRLPVIPGHQIVGQVEHCGRNAKRFSVGDRVGITWIHSSCGKCEYCRRGDENLCSEFAATGRDIHGGYAEFTTVNEEYALPLPDGFSDVQAAPLLCAGAIGYRSLRLSGLSDGQNLGLTGFGASAHLVLKTARHLFPHSQFFVFARSEKERTFAREIGADWAGDIADKSPERLHAIIDTTPAWKPVIESMENLRPGGRCVINAIRKEPADLQYFLTLDYARHLWMEKEMKTVANVTRRDVAEFLLLAAEIPLIPEVEVYQFSDANTALHELKKGTIRGAKVLQIGGPPHG
jgi:alcohol dehydrogenase, propanol-preferring